MSWKKYLEVYEFDTVLPGSGKKVKFRPIRTKQMKRLLTYENTTDPQMIEYALDEIITDCVIDEDFDISDLYLQDRFFLLLEMRKKTKGEKYKFEYKCPECESQTLINIDLDNLEVKKLGVTKTPAKSTEKNPKVKSTTTKTKKSPDIVKLNKSMSVRVEHIKRGFQARAMDIADGMEGPDGDLTENQKYAEASTLTYAQAIKGIITPEGEEIDVPLVDKVYFLDNIRQDEYEIFTKWYDDNDFGVKFEYDVICKHCGKKEHKDVPMDNFFF